MSARGCRGGEHEHREEEVAGGGHPASTLRTSCRARRRDRHVLDMQGSNDPAPSQDAEPTGGDGTGSNPLWRRAIQRDVLVALLPVGAEAAQEVRVATEGDA